MATIKLKNHFILERDRDGNEKGYWEAKHRESDRVFTGEDRKEVYGLAQDWLINNGGGSIKIKDRWGAVKATHTIRPRVEPTNLFS